MLVACSDIWKADGESMSTAFEIAEAVVLAAIAGGGVR
jgi:hypothetical protein